MAARPEAGATAVVVYDVNCGFCRKTVARLRTLDRERRLAFRPLQDESLYVAYPKLERAACERTLHLVAEDGRIHAGGAAMREVFARVGAAPLARVLGLPVGRTVTEIAYRLVAEHRSRIRL